MINLSIEDEFMVQMIRLDSNPKRAECHTNSKIVADELKKKGFSVRVVTGIYVNLPNKIIRHSWIEFEDKILETDPKQLREECDLMPEFFSAVLNKKDFSNRYREAVA